MSVADSIDWILPVRTKRRKLMKRENLAVILAALLLLLFSNSIQAAGGADEDTDTRMVGAIVVEVAEAHISVKARTGVEHVIAVDNAGTRVTIDGKAVSLKELREGDVVTVELDEEKPVKFAKLISMRSAEVARVRR
jgi:hypothetical protein